MGSKVQIRAAGWLSLWIVLSISVILCNKYILSRTPFRFPIALTMVHMLFISVVTHALVSMRVCKVMDVDRGVYWRYIAPISAMFAISLWLSMAAYCVLSVSFIQMLKASSPMAMYIAAVVFRLDSFSWATTGIVSIVAGGVAVASVGELAMSYVGMLAFVGSLVAETLRMVQLQMLSQKEGLRQDPITSLYYISPLSALLLLPPFLVLELRKLMQFSPHELPLGMLLLSCTMAAGLNFSVYGLIGATSALTMKVAGVVKDWLLIVLSVLLYKSPVTLLQCVGYAIALSGVGCYNYHCLPGKSSGSPEEKTSIIQSEIVIKPLGSTGTINVMSSIGSTKAVGSTGTEGASGSPGSAEHASGVAFKGTGSKEGRKEGRKDATKRTQAMQSQYSQTAAPWSSGHSSPGSADVGKSGGVDGFVIIRAESLGTAEAEPLLKGWGVESGLSKPNLESSPVVVNIANNMVEYMGSQVSATSNAILLKWQQPMQRKLLPK